MATNDSEHVVLGLSGLFRYVVNETTRVRFATGSNTFPLDSRIFKGLNWRAAT